MIPRNKPLKRSQQPIRKRRKVEKSSLRYDLVAGAYKRYPDGREVCLDNAKGEAEYRYRTHAMACRQRGRCGLEDSGNCKFPAATMMTLQSGFLNSATFEHGDKRGAGGARRNDNINAPGNCAAHAICNSVLGSRRIKS